MIKVIKTIFITVLSLAAIYISFASLFSTAKTGQINIPKSAATAITSFEITPVVDIDSQPLQDNPDLYQYNDPGSVVNIYVTVRRGDSLSNTDHTWSEINDLTKYLFGAPINEVVAQQAEAIVQFGNENGPLAGEVGFGAGVPNATIQIRGALTSLAAQRSYKVELYPGAGKWRGQSTINLNKHPYDNTRVRNKLSFDLLQQVPNMTSLQTQFVHLYVRDETTDRPSQAFVDYGLFTQIEQPNKKFLRNHLLDPDGQLYKANLFEFHRYPDQIRLADDPSYDVGAFSSILESKGNMDHTKLIRMLDEVNNPNIPIDQTFKQYFNSDNYFTWLAYNILVGNVSAVNQNFYLYSPHNGNKWYFLPWDYDGAFSLQDHPDMTQSSYAPWQNGVSNYWSAVLPNRLLRVPEYRQALDDKINEVRGILTPERIKSMLAVYKKAVDPYVTSMPDLEYLQGSLNSRDLEFELLSGDIQTNYDLYLESLKKPMPFLMGTPTVADGKLDFTWDASYDFGGQDITYDFAVSTDWEFKNIVTQSDLTNLTEIQIDMLTPGTYFWRVDAKNESGGIQAPYEYYIDADSVNHYGVKYFYITPDGKLLE